VRAAQDLELNYFTRIGFVSCRPDLPFSRLALNWNRSGFRPDQFGSDADPDPQSSRSASRI
jgi:hypothetical protein